MALAGSLSDVSVVDIIQFVHLGRKTGTLYADSHTGRGVVVFCKGQIISASSPHARNLGTVLVNDGALTDEQLEEALVAQVEARSNGQQVPLGRMLVERRLVTWDALTAALRTQIEESIHDLVAWQQGSFEFELNDTQPSDHIGVTPDELIPRLHLNTEMLLMEAVRIFDERQRVLSLPPEANPREPAKTDATDIHPAPRSHRSPAAGSTPSEPPLGTELPSQIPTALTRASGTALAPGGTDRLFLVTRDANLQREVRTALAEVESDAVALRSIEELPDPSAVVALDVREGQLSMGLFAKAVLAQPQARCVALVDDSTSLSQAYHAGACAALPAEPEVIRSWFEGQMHGRGFTERERRRRARQEHTQRLRHIFGELRTAGESATLSVQLMRIVAESAERGVLWVVKGRRLFPLGAFGTTPTGVQMNTVARDLMLSLDEAFDLAEVVKSRSIHCGSAADLELPVKLSSLLGPSQDHASVILPVTSEERTVLLVYADTREAQRLQRELDVFQIVIDQIGIVLENELLRRRFSASGPKAHRQQAASAGE